MGTKYKLRALLFMAAALLREPLRPIVIAIRSA